MNFLLAVRLLKEGKKVTRTKVLEEFREGFDTDWYVEFKDQNYLQIHGTEDPNAELLMDDFEAEDWEEYNE